MSETPESEQMPNEVNPQHPAEQPRTASGKGADVSEAQSPSQAVPAPEPEQPRRDTATRAPATSTQRGTAVSIHYNLSFVVANEAAGPRGAIVLLHDLPGGAFVWEGIISQLAATGHAVYAFDMLGYGQSDHPWPSDTSIWGHADALLYAFEGLKLQEITLVGIGLGGAVAQVLANRIFREHVAKLVLINSYAFQTAFAPDWPLPDMVKHQDPEAPHHANLQDVLNDLRNTLPKGAVSKLSGDRIAAYVNEWNSDVGKHVLYQHVRLMIPSYVNSVSTDNASLQIPVLLLWGEQDTVTPPVLGERLRDEIPGAQLVTIANAGHLLLEDAPGEVARRLADFAR
ncbi:MAG TPA: alpha/beta hydrolase [Ktedonobacterales bacterium]